MTAGDATNADPDRPADEVEATIEPIVVRGSEAARLLDISPQSFRRLGLSGQVPKPLHIGRSRRWSVVELRAWVAAGCPCRQRWEFMKPKPEV